MISVVELSVKVNNLFGADVPTDEMVRRAAAAGADAVGYWPWYDDDLEVLVEAAATAGVDIAYLSGGSETVAGPEFPLTDPDVREAAIEELERAIEVAAAVDSDFLNVIPGRRMDTRDPAQHRHDVVDALRQVAGLAERVGVTVLVEPVNTAVDHPGIYLTSSYDGYNIVDAVDSPNVRLLYDVYHQQITEGNIIANLRSHLNAVGHVHVGDVPGRHEPGTGEIDYPSVLHALADAGYDGYVGAEFEPTGTPEAAIRHVAALLESVQ